MKPTVELLHSTAELLRSTVEILCQLSSLVRSTVELLAPTVVIWGVQLSTFGEYKIKYIFLVIDAETGSLMQRLNTGCRN